MNKLIANVAKYFKTLGFSTLIFTSLLLSQTTAWRGTVSTAWENAANWTNGVPTATSTVILGDVAPTRQPTISSTVTIAALSFRSASAITLTIGTGGSLIVTGDVSGTWTANQRHTIAIGAQTMYINGNFTSGTSNFRRINITISSGTLNIRGDYTGTGTLTFSATGYMYIGGNYTSTGAFTRSTSTVIFDGTGNQTVKATTYYNLVINKTSGTANLAGATTIRGGTLNVAQGTLNIGGNTLDARNNVIVNGIISGTGSITLSTNTATIDGTGQITNTGTITISANKTFLSTANLTIAGQITINNGITVTNNGTVTSTSANGIVGGGATATWINAGGSTLNIAGPLLATGTLNASANPNTVNYNGTTVAQTVKATTYYNLVITKGTQTATLGGNITVNGDLTIASGTLACSTYSMTLNGNFANAGTFNGNTGLVTMAGTNATISGAGTFNFYTLSVTGSGVTVAANSTLTIADNLSTSGAGTFTHTAGGTGIITMSGTAKTISGDNIQLDDLTVTGSVTMNNSMAMTGNLNVSGSFTGATGTTLTMSGNGSTISGSGTITLSSLSVINNVTATTSVQINQNLSGGTITATSGTFTFNGNPSQLSGTANLYDVTVSSGAALRLMTNAQLGIANIFTLTGALDAVNGGTPNTVVYNGTGAQTVLSATYHNLTLSNGNTKTANGVLTINGNLLINTGTTFSAGTYTHTIQGNITNNGAFTPGTSTVQMTGSNDATINGTSATTFNVLTINKSNTTNTITLGTNVTAGMVNMTSGNINTGSNSITITNTRTGNGYIIGTITRTHSYFAGIAYAFESPYNTVTFSTVGTVSSITITVTIGAVGDFPFGGSINRQYNISVTGSGYTATLRLHYLDEELNGNNEASMQLWRYNGTTWNVSGKTGNNETDNWVEQSGLTNITNRWTISDDQNVVHWNGGTSSSWSTASNWTAVQGSPSLPPSANDIVQLGTSAFSNQPVISSNVSIKNMIFGSAQSVTLTISSGGSLTTTGINGQWSANAVHTIDVGSQTLTVNGDISLSDGAANHSINLNLSSGSITITGTLSQSGNASVSLGSGSLTISGNFNYTSGTFSAGSSTVTYNGAADQIIGGVNYNNLVVSKSGGTANLNSPATVNGNFTLSTGGTFSANANLTVNGNINIGTSTTLNANNSTITVGGNWVRAGTFNPGTSTVILNGSNDQAIDATTFNNLVINKPAGIASPTGALVINGNFTVASGIFDLSNYTVNRASLGGTFSLSANTVFRLSGASNFPANYATYSLATSSTVEYYGTTAQTVQGGISYGNLTINKSGASATLGSSTTIAGDLTIQNNSALNSNSYSITLQGNWINNGTFNAGTGAVQLAGTGKAISGSSQNTFNNLTVSGSYTSSVNNSVNGTLAITATGILTAGSTTLNIIGNLSNNGTLTSSGIINFAGTQAQTIAMNAGFLSNGTVNFNGTVAPVFSGSSPPTFNNLNINNTAGISPTTGWTVNGAFTVAEGSTFNGGSVTHTFNGQFTNNGIITSSGVLRFLPSSPVTITLYGTSFTSTGTVEFGGSGQLTIAGASPNISTLTISNTHPAGVTLPAGWTINGDLNISSGALLNGGAFNYTINGSINNSGTLNGQSSTITMTGTGESIAGEGTVFNNLTIASGASIALNSSISITGNLIVNGTLDASSQTIIFTGNTSSIIGGAVNPINLSNLTIDKTSAATTLAQNIAGINALYIKNGMFDIATYTMTQDIDGGSITMDANTYLRIGGASGLPAFETYDLDPLSIVEYYSNSPQTVTQIDYGSLLFSGSGIKTINTNLLANGDFTISTGTPVTLNGTITLTVNGNWQDNGNFSPGTSTIRLSGSGKSISGATNFNNLDITGSITNLGTATVNGELTGSGTLTQGNNSTFIINGQPITINAINAEAYPNVIIYAGINNQVIKPTTYYDLIIRNSGTKTASTNFVVNNDLTVEEGSKLDIGSGITIQVIGKVTTAGAINNNGKLLISD